MQLFLDDLQRLLEPLEGDMPEKLTVVLPIHVTPKHLEPIRNLLTAVGISELQAISDNTCFTQALELPADVAPVIVLVGARWTELRMEGAAPPYLTRFLPQAGSGRVTDELVALVGTELLRHTGVDVNDDPQLIEAVRKQVADYIAAPLPPETLDVTVAGSIHAVPAATLIARGQTISDAISQGVYELLQQHSQAATAPVIVVTEAPAWPGLMSALRQAFGERLRELPGAPRARETAAGMLYKG